MYFILSGTAERPLILFMAKGLRSNSTSGSVESTEELSDLPLTRSFSVVGWKPAWW
jgi:hypothetical protein